MVIRTIRLYCLNRCFRLVESAYITCLTMEITGCLRSEKREVKKRKIQRLLILGSWGSVALIRNSIQKAISSKVLAQRRCLRIGETRCAPLLKSKSKMLVVSRSLYDGIHPVFQVFHKTWKKYLPDLKWHSSITACERNS